MKIKDIIIIIIGLILAYFVLKISWILAIFFIKVALFLIIAFIIYLFLKKILWLSFEMMINMKNIEEKDYNLKIDEKSIKNISRSIATDVSNRIYSELLLARYLPEIIDIEKGNVVPIKIEDFKEQLKSKLSHQ